MPGLVGKKLGMTSIYSAEGKSLPCTLIEVGPCVVTQVKTSDKDGYDAIQLGFGDRKDNHTPKAMAGHFKKAKTTPKQHIAEFRSFNQHAQGVLEEDLLLTDRNKALPVEYDRMVGMAEEAHSGSLLVEHGRRSFLQVIEVDEVTVPVVG